VAAFAAHEPACPHAENFWNGDLPYGEGEVRGVLLGSSRIGTDVDVHALADATGFAWQRIARHSVQQASIAASYPRMLGASSARPGLDVLVVEVSPLLYDATGCARPELANLPLEPQWWGPLREVLGDDAALLPSIAMTYLPHRWPMSSGRRSDIVTHARDPGHALALLTDLPGARHGFEAPRRWAGEPSPDLDEERLRRRREFLLGGSLDTFVPSTNAECLQTLESMIVAARPRRTLLVLPPMRTRFTRAVPTELHAALDGALAELATRLPGVEVWDASSRFEAEEDVRFLDFDHLSEAGAERFTAELAGRVAP
jgi:hypothetical protein